MRKTRDSNWQFFLFLIPAIAAGFGIHYMLKKNKNVSVATNTPATSSERNEKSTGDFSENLTDKVSQMTTKMTEELSEDQDAPEEDLADAKNTRAPASVGEGKTKPPSVAATVPAIGASTADKTCTSFELRGDGMAETHVSNEEWSKVMGLFHQSKADLQAWLVTHNAELPGGLVKWMSEQVENAKLQRPPLAEEPDLNWRGIGVVVHVPNTAANAAASTAPSTANTSENTSPLLRVGGGFVKMSMTEPQRAHFELTRLLAQSWNPCDLPTGARATWQPLLQCMGLKEQDWDFKKSCAPGTQSEAGWAVASAIAVKATPPGCVLPAFQNAALFQCVTKTAWLEDPKPDKKVDLKAALPAEAKPIVKADEQKAKAPADHTSEIAVELKKPEVPVVRTPASLPPNASSGGPKQ